MGLGKGMWDEEGTERQEGIK
jgi:hypothetical protein